ncbi:PRC-barrel domain-containing protein [Dankookia sp. GCM10030260]
MILAAVAALIAAASTGTPATADPLRMEAESGQMTPLGIAAGEVKGATLHGEHGDILGEIEQVLASRGGQVTALVVEVGDGVIGIGEKEVLLRFDQVHREGDRIVTRLSEAQLGAQPPWDD